jgi:hypothetical protein
LGRRGAGKESDLRSILASSDPTIAASSGADRPRPERLLVATADRLGEVAGVHAHQVIATYRAAGADAQRLLDRVDGVVFVVDARRDRIDELRPSRSYAAHAATDRSKACRSSFPVQPPRVDPYVLEELHRKLA